MTKMPIKGPNNTIWVTNTEDGSYDPITGILDESGRTLYTEKGLIVGKPVSPSGAYSIEQLQEWGLVGLYKSEK